MNLATVRAGTVAVLYGGDSAERAISLQSGEAIRAALDAAGFRVRAVDTAQPGWLATLGDVTFAFVALHGRGGEDGTVQGALEVLRIPYSGSDVLGSALAMDKRRSKALWLGCGLPTAEFVVLNAGSDWQAVIDRLGKVFVKPSAEGSSIGMAPAASAAELADAYALAAQHGDEVLAERFIEGPEYTVALYDGRALPCIRLEVAGGFYDYHAKYLAEDTGYHIPSGLDAAAERDLGALALRAFEALGCGVWGRVDAMRDGAGRFQLLEVNTVPGMTSHSLVPMAARAAGMGMQELVSGIVEASLRARRGCR